MNNILRTSLLSLIFVPLLGNAQFYGGVDYYPVKLNSVNRGIIDERAESNLKLISSAWGLYAGYSFSRWFGLELGYHQNKYVNNVAASQFTSSGFSSDQLYLHARSVLLRKNLLGRQFDIAAIIGVGYDNIGPGSLPNASPYRLSEYLPSPSGQYLYMFPDFRTQGSNSQNYFLAKLGADATVTIWQGFSARFGVIYMSNFEKAVPIGYLRTDSSIDGMGQVVETKTVYTNVSAISFNLTIGVNYMLPSKKANK